MYIKNTPENRLLRTNNLTELTKRSSRGGRKPTGMYVLSERAAYSYYDDPSVVMSDGVRDVILKRERELLQQAGYLRQILDLQRVGTQ